MHTVNFETNGRTVRTTIECTADEWRKILAALKTAERRKTVRAKRPAQQRKGKNCPQCGGAREWENPINHRLGPCPVCNPSGKLSPVA